MSGQQPTVLWWGKFDAAYSRNRTLRKILGQLGWKIRDFIPRISQLADLEADMRRLPTPDLIWVPCFRHRDMAAAARWARRRKVPLLFDPLISAYDKQVDERMKFDANSVRAKRLLAWERKLFQQAQLVIADTEEHAHYFQRMLGAAADKLAIVYVGADSDLFTPAPLPQRPPETPIEVLFYGSFIPLQGPQVVVQAARQYDGPPVKWTLLGDGPLRKECAALAATSPNIVFEDWIPFESLPDRIKQASVLLGVFGTTPKTKRVIPNKVFQSLACGRPVITSRTAAYPECIATSDDSGLIWTGVNAPGEIAARVAWLADNPDALARSAEAAASTYRNYFSEDQLRVQLLSALAKLGPHLTQNVSPQSLSTHIQKTDK